MSTHNHRPGPQPLEHRGRSFSPQPTVLSLKTMPRSNSAPPCLDYSPGDHCEEPTFTVNSIPVVRRLLTLQMEGWGHKKFPPETCVYVQDLPPIELGKIAEDGFVRATRRPFFMSGQKRRRSPSFSIPSKQPKLQHNLARSSTVICSPAVSVPSVAGNNETTFQHFPLLINVRCPSPSHIIPSWFLRSS